MQLAREPAQELDHTGATWPPIPANALSRLPPSPFALPSPPSTPSAPSAPLRFPHRIFLSAFCRRTLADPRQESDRHGNHARRLLRVCVPRLCRRLPGQAVGHLRPRDGQEEELIAPCRAASRRVPIIRPRRRRWRARPELVGCIAAAPASSCEDLHGGMCMFRGAVTMCGCDQTGTKRSGRWYFAAELTSSSSWHPWESLWDLRQSVPLTLSGRLHRAN